jgi:sugar phosphate isomerase/epimerase
MAKFALCSEVYDDRPLAEGFRRMAAIGYTGVEIAPYQMATDVRTLDRAYRREVAAAACAAGLEVVGLHWLLARTEGFCLTSLDPAERARTGDYLGALAELCADLGGQVLVLGSPQQRMLAPGESFAEALPRACDVLRGAARRCELVGVQLLIEPLGPRETNFINTAAEGLQLAEAVGSPAVGLHLDVKAMATEARPIPEIIRACQGRFAHFHANDELARGPGFGPTDLRPVAAALQEIGYTGWVSVEPFDVTPGRDVVAAQSLAYLRECFGPVV